jgi:hypothetical protein
MIRSPAPALTRAASVWVRPSRSDPDVRAGPVPIQPQPHAFVDQPHEVLEIGRVVAVADVDPVEIESLIFEDGYLLLANTAGRIAVGRDAHAGLFRGAGGRAQNDPSRQ